MITIKIDVTKIDKSRLYKGTKGTYLSAVLIPTPNGKEDYMIVEEVTKQEREAGKKGTILGNGKEFKKHTPEPKEQIFDKEQIQDDTPLDADGLPF